MADSIHSRILENLPKYGYKENTLFNAIKVAHHGSSGNIDEKLLTLIDSPFYLIATNGKKYDHPDLETIARIVCRETSSERTLILNYKEIFEKLNQSDWRKDHKYNLNEPDGKTVVLNI